MRPILLVEDSTLFGKLVKKKIKDTLGIPVVWAKSFAETEDALKSVGNGFELAILDLNLPDAPRGEVIPLVTGRGISSFVFTADVTDELREMVWSEQVADYIVKDDPSSLDYLVAAIGQLLRNETILVLIINSSGALRNVLSELLYVRKYRVINASSAEMGLNILNEHSETRLVLCDAELSDMEGYQLCRKLRENYKQDRLAIIGMVSGNKQQAGIHFLKSGVNEVINTDPLIVEELYAKLQFSLENVDLRQKVSRAAKLDPLTGLLNRQSFLTDGYAVLEALLSAGSCGACLLLRPERFDDVNGHLGYESGDTILVKLATMFRQSVGESGLAARFGSTTFGLFFGADSEQTARAYTQEIDEHLSLMDFGEIAGSADLQLTFSLGLAVCCHDLPGGFAELLLAAEQELKADMKR